MPTKPHFVVDPTFPNSKEMVGIPRRYRLAAHGAWQVAGCWSAEKMTDGWVPVTALVELLVTPLLADLLVSSTLWIPAVDNGPAPIAWAMRGARATAVQFTNWPKWQKTKEQWTKQAAANARRQREFKERMSGGRAAETQRDSNALLAVAELVASNGTEIGGNALGNCIEERSTSVETKELSAVGGPNGHAPAFLDHCALHRYDPDPPRCGACRATRVQNQQAEQQQADVAAVTAVANKAASKRRLTECPDCDEHGWQLDIWGEQPVEPAIKCTHPRIL